MWSPQPNEQKAHTPLFSYNPFWSFFCIDPRAFGDEWVYCRLVASACYAVPISQGAGREKMQRQQHSLRKILIKKSFITKGLEIFMGLGKLSCCWNIFWLILLKLVVTDDMLWLTRSVCYCAFGSLTGGFGQFCLFIVSLHVLTCVCTVSLPHLTLLFYFYWGI